MLGHLDTKMLQIRQWRHPSGPFEATVERAFADGERGRELIEQEPVLKRRFHTLLSARDKRTGMSVFLKMRRVRG
ncbi:hypothetical protein [Paraburkholderia sp. RAU2J]|uniref:hypothetical protein n=1 Tax=Paraburkholderia sp. RAU2J TaxID=1938810 RepID=UPI000EAE776C|nr:hypothetical protein [Paraburkholderia sp. RAU2J]